MRQFNLSSVYATMISSRTIKSYRKISKDLTEPSLSGSGLSIVAALLMLFLFRMELNDYLTVSTSTSVVVDKSTDGELRILLNISFPSLSCEFASVDLNDVLGTNRVNITQTIHKFSIDHNLSSTGPEFDTGGVPKLLKHGDEGDEEYGEGSVSLTAVKFERFTHQYPILVVNFFSPRSYWSNCLQPSWEKTSQIIRERYDPDLDGRILLAKVDCTVEVELCKRNHIQEYPSIRIFRKGSDVKDVRGHHAHESYYGDRDTDTLVATMESLVETDNTKRPASMSGGCRIEGFLCVKKVPGNLVISARSGAHSFDPSQINMSHVITHLSFGKRVSSKLESEVSQLKGREYITQHEDVTIKHYLQIVKTELVSRRSGREHKLIEEYEYTIHSSLVQSFDAPVVKFHFELSPLQVVVTEIHKPFSHFITNVYAIIGGVFAVARILNSVLHNTIRHVKKVEVCPCCHRRYEVCL